MESTEVGAGAGALPEAEAEAGAGAGARSAILGVSEASKMKLYETFASCESCRSIWIGSPVCLGLFALPH
jgi:hypothetical protein